MEDIVAAHQRRRRAERDATDYMQAMNRAESRAGRIDARPRNVPRDADGRAMPFGMAEFNASRSRRVPSRAENVAASKADGSFEAKRMSYNNNASGYVMDADGNIQAPKPKGKMMPTPDGGERFVKSSPSPAPPPPKPPQPSRPTPSPTARNRQGGLIDGKPAGEWFAEHAKKAGQPNRFANTDGTPRARGVLDDSRARPAVAAKPQATAAPAKDIATRIADTQKQIAGSKTALAAPGPAEMANRETRSFDRVPEASHSSYQKPDAADNSPPQREPTPTASAPPKPVAPANNELQQAEAERRSALGWWGRTSEDRAAHIENRKKLEAKQKEARRTRQQQPAPLVPEGLTKAVAAVRPALANTGLAIKTAVAGDPAKLAAAEKKIAELKFDEDRKKRGPTFTPAPPGTNLGQIIRK